MIAHVCILCTLPDFSLTHLQALAIFDDRGSCLTYRFKAHSIVTRPHEVYGLHLAQVLNLTWSIGFCFARLWFYVVDNGG